MHVRLARLLTLLVCQYDSFNEVKTRTIRAVSNFPVCVRARLNTQTVFHNSIRWIYEKVVLSMNFASRNEEV